jgi:phage baseplate assembly protein gpV
VQSDATRAVRSRIKLSGAQNAEEAARAILGRIKERELLAQASQDLNTRIDLTDDEIRIVADAVTILQAAIPGLARADALQALETTVTGQGDSLTSLSQSLLSLTSEVGDNAGAITDLAATKVDGDGAVSAVDTLVAAEFGDLSTFSAFTQWAIANANGANAGFRLSLDGTDILRAQKITPSGDLDATTEVRLGGDAIFLDGDTTVSGSFRVSGENIILNGNTFVDGSFKVSGDTVVLDAFTVVMGGFQVRGGSVVLDAATVVEGDFFVTGQNIGLNGNTVVDGSFQVSGGTVVLDAFTVVNGGFQVRGQQVLLDATTVVNGDFFVTGQNIGLNGNTVVDGSFQVSGGNVVLDGNTVVTGGFQVRGDTVVLDANTAVNGDFKVSGGNIFGETINAENIVANGITRFAVAGSGEIKNNSATFTTIATATFEAPVDFKAQGLLSFLLTDQPADYPNDVLFRALIQGTVVANITKAGLLNANARRINLPVTLGNGVAAASVEIKFEVQNAGGLGAESSSYSVTGFLR